MKRPIDVPCQLHWPKMWPQCCDCKVMDIVEWASNNAGDGPILERIHDLTCQRCGAEAELGKCSFCHRQLCVECYDADQETTRGRQVCRFDEERLRNDAIRALRGGGMSRDEVAEHLGLSTMTISRVTRT